MGSKLASAAALGTIATHAERDYVSEPLVSILGTLGRITVARLHFSDGGDRIASVGWYGEGYRDDHGSDRTGYVTDEDALALVVDHFAGVAS